jgi:hypothetical protein
MDYTAFRTPAPSPGAVPTPRLASARAEVASASSQFMQAMTPTTDVNQGIVSTLSALRSTLGSQGAAIRGAENTVKSQQSELARLCIGLADLQAITAATSTELAGLRESTSAADETALAQVRRVEEALTAEVHRLQESTELQARRRGAEVSSRLEALLLQLNAAEERARADGSATERRLEALSSGLALCATSADVSKMAQVARPDTTPHLALSHSPLLCSPPCPCGRRRLRPRRTLRLCSPSLSVCARGWRQRCIARRAQTPRHAPS